jgi:hypothetical protein
MLGALQIVEANCMGTVTSLWVISHTLPLVLLSNNKPKFDKQSEVYSQLQILLDNAITNLSGINPSWTRYLLSR